MAATKNPEKAHMSLVRPASAAEREEFADRRTHRRLTLSELSWLNHVRLKYGPVVSLIDLSQGGAQIEATTRLQPGSTVVVEIAGREGEFAIPARVLRCHVAGLVPHPTYRGALWFKRPFELPRSPTGGDQGDAGYNPAHECARLSLALKRSFESEGPRLASATPGAAAMWAGAIATLLAMLESASGLRAGAPYRREMSHLLRAVIRCVENSAAPDVLLTEIVERVRRSVPVLAIRVVDAGAALKLRGSAVFDMPAAPNRTAAKLLVELPLGCRLEEWHREFLKGAAQLIALTQDIAPAGQPGPEPEADRDKVLETPYGWHRLVVRYTDGRMMKGYTRHFMPTRKQIDVWSAPDGPPESRVTIPLTHLKAAFFVQELEGLAPQAAAPSETDPGAGRRVVVTFNDGEVLSGTTLSYSPDGPGFFVVPAEAKTNNLRIFVVSGAIRHVRFP
ncbi:MAG: PilZ domain-containing protein [Vicinamibacterales bacterium]